MKHRKKAQHDSGLTKICVILGTLTFSSRGSLALYEFGRPSCMSFTVFHKFIIICLNHVFLEALIHFHFLSSSLLLISHSIICSARHQMTTRGITYTFYFQSNPFSFFFQRKGHFIIVPQLYRIRLKKPLMRTYAGHTGNTELSH